MLKNTEKILEQFKEVKASLDDLLKKFDVIKTNIEKSDWHAVKKEEEKSSDFLPDDEKTKIIKLLEETRNSQNELAALQAKLADYGEKLEWKLIGGRDINSKTSLKIVPEGVKLIIYNEYPPKTSIYDKLTIKNGKLTNYAYAEARDRWYGLIKKAVEGYKGERIVPAIIIIKYYVPKLCDTGNFLSKFILDGLMYYGPAPLDDNLLNVNIVAQEAIIDKVNQRTEIYILKNTGQFNSVYKENN